jgi:hypothetical protein
MYRTWKPFRMDSYNKQYTNDVTSDGLISWNRVLLEKPIVAQPLKKLPEFFRVGIFIVVCTRTCHWSLPWATWISLSVSLRSILIFDSCLCLYFPCGILMIWYIFKRFNFIHRKRIRRIRVFHWKMPLYFCEFLRKDKKAKLSTCLIK